MYEVQPPVAYPVVFPWYESGKNKEMNIWNVEGLTVLPHRESILRHIMSTSIPRTTKTTFSLNRNLLREIFALFFKHNVHPSIWRHSCWIWQQNKGRLGPEVYKWWAGEQSDPQTPVVYICFQHIEAQSVMGCCHLQFIHVSLFILHQPLRPSPSQNQ